MTTHARFRTPAAAAALLIALATAREAIAIPAFARKYGTACNTCHVAVPKLNDFGEAFRLNGFKIPPDDELLTKDEPVSLGAKALKDEWPETFLPASIPGLPPISVQIQWALTQTEGDDRKGDFDSPALTWMLGANIGSSLSVFGELGPKQRAYVKVDDFLNNPLFGNWVPPRLLDLRFGLLEPAVVAFSSARRLPLTDHILYNANYRFPSGNGNPFKFDRQIAAELMGIVAQRLRYVVGVTNGSNEGGENNSKKDLYYRLAYKLGGIAFTGKEQVEESLEAKENWTDNSVTVGAFGYHGFNTVPTAGSASLRALWNGREIGFLLEWNDPTRSEAGLPDSAFLQLAAEADARPYFLLGDKDHAVKLWHWQAGGGAEEWTAKGPVEVSVAPAAFEVSSVFEEGRWRVIFRRALGGEPAFEHGRFLPILFSARDGQNGERGEVRALSTWLYATLEPPPSVRPWLSGLASALGALIAIVWTVSRLRS